MSSESSSSGSTPRSLYSKRGYTIVKHRYSHAQLETIKRDLTCQPFTPSDFGAKAPSFPIYMENEKKMYLPKHYAFAHPELGLGQPERISITKGSEIDIVFKGKMLPKQMEVIQAFQATCGENYRLCSNGGVVCVPCGFGKTVLGLYLASVLRRKTLIIVHKEFLLNQWKERIASFLPDAQVGIIQGNRLDVMGKDIVIGMLQSISMKDYDESVFQDFGFVIVDECHHIAAEVFSRALPKINSYYCLGLSATPNRSDGLTRVFQYFLGPVIFKIDKRDDKKILVHSLHFHYTEDQDYSHEEKTMMGKPCLPKMITNIASCPVRNQFILGLILRILEEDTRKILLLSDRREHLETMYALVEPITTVGYYVGGMKQRALKSSESCQVILGTYAMSAEGLDIPDLNTVIFMTPKSSIEQSIGRIIRKDHDVVPTAYDIVDCFSLFPSQSKKRNVVYRKLDYDVETRHVYATSRHTALEFKEMMEVLEREAPATGSRKSRTSCRDSDEDNDRGDDNLHGKKAGGSTARGDDVCLIDDDE